MLKTVFPRLLVTALFLASAQIAFTQTADDIVEKHLSALGGRAGEGSS